MSAPVDPWMACMRSGDWEGAWRVSDAVLRERAGVPCWHLERHEQYIWTGESLDGKRVLVRCYHGLGDTIQFVRFIPRLAAIASEVILWTQPALIPLIRDVPGIARLLPLHDGVPDAEYDADIELMELQHYFRVTPDTVPRDIPYLHAEPVQLPGGDAFNVGLVWRAGDWDPRRPIPVELLEPLSRIPGVVLHSLQRGAAAVERPTWIQHDSGSDDITAAAGVMRALDLVISIDTMPVHLAGALGVPAWVLLHSDPDWRWMLGRDDSPWYPTVRLFRQDRPGAWGGVVQRVVDALRPLAESRLRERATHGSAPAQRA